MPGAAAAPWGPGSPDGCEPARGRVSVGPEGGASGRRDCARGGRRPWRHDRRPGAHEGDEGEPLRPRLGLARPVGRVHHGDPGGRRDGGRSRDRHGRGAGARLRARDGGGPRQGNRGPRGAGRGTRRLADGDRDGRDRHHDGSGWNGCSGLGRRSGAGRRPGRPGRDGDRAGVRERAGLGRPGDQAGVRDAAGDRQGEGPTRRNRVGRDREADLAAGGRPGTNHLGERCAEGGAEDQAEDQERDLGGAHDTPVRPVLGRAGFRASVAALPGSVNLAGARALRCRAWRRTREGGPPRVQGTRPRPPGSRPGPGWPGSGRTGWIPGPIRPPSAMHACSWLGNLPRIGGVARRGPAALPEPLLKGTSAP